MKRCPNCPNTVLLTAQMEDAKGCYMMAICNVCKESFRITDNIEDYLPSKSEIANFVESGKVAASKQSRMQ